MDVSTSCPVVGSSRPGKFAYVGRLVCACGEPLESRGRAIRTTAAWGEVSFVRCTACGNWCQSPQIEPATLSAWYDSDDYQGSARRRGSVYVNYLEDEPERMVEARQRYQRDIAPFLPNEGGRVLEVGCATGSLLAVVREAGHEVVGLDLSRRFVDAARTLHGLDVRVGDVSAVDIPERHFDVILLFGTISNLADLPRSLARIHRLLKSRGTLILNYPAADALVARIYGSRFWMFAPSVATFLSEQGCRTTLAHAGFTVLRSRTDRQRPSLSKLLNHARMHPVLSLLQRLGLAHRHLPFAIPIPGVRIVWAHTT